MENAYNDFLICYYALDKTEEYFFYKILKLIIDYPIRWFNFLENILKNKLMVSFQNMAMIISIELIPPQQQKYFDYVYKIMIESGVIFNSIKKKGFLILYLYSKRICDFLEHSGFWLEYLTSYACFEIGYNSYRGVLLKTSDKTIQEIDVLIDLDTLVFLIECKDTCNFGIDELKKIDNLRKKISMYSIAILVCSKSVPNLNYDKYEINVINYKYNYFIFRNELKELIIKKLLSLSF